MKQQDVRKRSAEQRYHQSNNKLKFKFFYCNCQTRRIKAQYITPRGGSTILNPGSDGLGSENVFLSPYIEMIDENMTQLRLVSYD